LDTERGYTVTVYVPAVDENSNKLLNNTLSVGFEVRSRIETIIPTIESRVKSAEDFISELENSYNDQLKPAAEDLWSKFANSFL